ncbi:hypothetical protein BOO86_23760 [Mycobacterium sp. CBMA 234]|uniref:DUF3817 domain-containing protein n=1 Tax=Mycolicibacterium sp. CBMA 234 TaxID=1918495 RepID=UPI0012DD2139|nr:DUF3817 domain-containing protein [Mycolicibacterium sp. CBMA 234]MUL67511.1 hypothetical protein [Mycolicibacterium sp. CBMA 234]
MTESQPTAVSKDSIRKALIAYRVMAWATGIWLIALCYELVAHYIFNDVSLNWIGIVHGWVYFIYLLCTFNLAVKVRWPLGQTIGTLFAGTVPLLGIIVEHFRTEDVRKRFDLV